MTDQLTIKCAPADKNNRRLVIAILGSREWTDRLDVGDAFKRAKFREAVIARFGLDDSAHEFIETRIHAAADEADEAGGPIVTPKLTVMADIQVEQTQWFWEGYIPTGAITDLHSDPGEGKSTILTDLSARETTGVGMPPAYAPPGTYTPGNVLLLQAEDDPARTTLPRLKAAGADVSRVFLLRTVDVLDEERPIQLPLDLATIEQVILDKQITFMGVDVLSCFTEANTSMNDDAAMRRLFSPWSAMLERTQVAALMLRHMNKKSQTAAMYRAGGSIAIIGACRAAYCIGRSPDDPEERIFANVKSNLGPRPASLTYRIEPFGDTSRIVWGGESSLTANDVLGSDKRRGSTKTEQAKDIIADILSGGPRGSNEVEQAIEAAGISRSTYWTARKQLGVKAEKTGFDDGQWLLSVPSTNGAPEYGF